MIATISATNSDQGGNVIKMTPLTNGLTAAPSQPNDWAEK